MEFENFLSRLEKVKKTGENQYLACCPAHDDKKQSMSVTLKDGRILVNCFAGCDARDIVSAMGLVMRDLFIDDKSSFRQAKPEKISFLREHIYHDSVGNPVSKKVIYKNGDGKTGVWYRYENGKFIKSDGETPFKKPLYRLHELAGTTGTVYIVEGEKDVETMEEMGFTATTLPNGAGSRWQTEYNAYLQNRDIIILSDNDDAGRKAAEKTAKRVYLVAKSLKVIPSENILPGLKNKGDISDIVQQVGKDEAKRLLLKAVDSTGYNYIQEAPKLLDVELPKYIYCEKDKRKVNPALLAKAFREKEHFKLVKDPVNNTAVFYIYKNGVYKAISDSLLKGYIKQYITDYDESILKMPNVEEAYKNLMTDLEYVKPDELDSRQNIINFENGLLDLDTMTLLPHTPDILSTIQLPCKWKQDAPEPIVFNRFMNTLTNGDTGAKELLVQFIGITLSNVPGYKFKKALFLFGKGNTGKSQLRTLVERLLGSDNCCAVDLVELEERFGMANIFGKRLIGSNDMTFARVKQISKFKLLTGGDAVEIERKGKDKFTAVYKGVIWFCTNELPRFGGDRGDWVYERIMPVECRNVIAPENQDKYICEKMFAEREGIVKMAVEALRRAIDNGYTYNIPSSSLALLDEYKEQNSPALSFYKECCVMRNSRTDDDCTVNRMFDVFSAWCRRNNSNYILKPKEFKREIADYLNVSVDDLTFRKKDGKHYIFTLTTDAKKEYEKIYGYDSGYNTNYS
ncbi:MAG: toprim domain-containing protein [Eubacterium sp.]|nr:toprim domain-containing protein [Eubacterium sp.]